LTVKLRRASNAPHHGMGEFGRVKRKGNPGGGTHVAQRTNSGYDDRKGYKGSAQAKFGSTHSGKAPRIDREAGHYHPVGHGSSLLFREDTADTKRMLREVTGREASERRDGRHSGKPSRGDTSARKGAVGNGKGSAPPGVGKGIGVRGTPESHRVGQGGPGKIGKSDGWKGHSATMSEDLGSEWFEKLGAE